MMRQPLNNLLTFLIVLILSLFFPNLGFAQATYLQKDTPAPYDGILLDPHTANDMKAAVFQRDLLRMHQDNESELEKAQHNRSLLWGIAIGMASSLATVYVVKTITR